MTISYRKKSVQLRTDGTPTIRASVSAIWGPKALDNLVELDLQFVVETEASVLRRLGKTQDDVYGIFSSMDLRRVV